jgi:hypothetical protein
VPSFDEQNVDADASRRASAGQWARSTA